MNRQLKTLIAETVRLLNDNGMGWLAILFCLLLMNREVLVCQQISNACNGRVDIHLLRRHEYGVRRENLQLRLDRRSRWDEHQRRRGWRRLGRLMSGSTLTLGHVGDGGTTAALLQFLDVFTVCWVSNFAVLAQVCLTMLAGQNLLERSAGVTLNIHFVLPLKTVWCSTLGKVLHHLMCERILCFLAQFRVQLCSQLLQSQFRMSEIPHHDDGYLALFELECFTHGLIVLVTRTGCQDLFWY